MEARHIKLEYGESLNTKKHVLASEINLLNALAKIRNYKELRIKELMLKDKLRVRMKELKKKLGLLNSYFPASVKIEPKKKASKKTKDVKEYSDIKEELEEIKGKLERLG